MKTDVISIYGDLHGQSAAMQEAEHFTEYLHLTGKNAMHIRLLTEEAVSLVHGIIPDFKGNFWLESEQTDNGLLCRICVSADANVSEGQEEQLLAVSTSGKNEDAKGIMGKIRQLFRWSMQQADAEAFAQSTAGTSWFEMGCYGSHINTSAALDYYWSLSNYRSKVEDNPQTGGEERDELEKSIVAKLSDEVKVGIRSGKAEVMIEKYISN